MGRKLLTVKDLKTGYKTRLGEQVNAVDGVSLQLEEGKTLGIAGESGCGKSTLAMSLMCYYYPPLFYRDGTIELNGVDIARSRMNRDNLRRMIYGKEIAYIPQAAMNALNPTRKIINFIGDVLREHNPGISDKEILKIARERFETLNLSPSVLDQHAVELSGGMKQRTVIAISTILNPTILIADEPSSALDVTSQKMVIKLLHELLQRKFIKSMIFITHELPLLYNVTDDIMVMYAGRIVEYGTAEDMIFHPMHPYSKGLMSAIIVPEKGNHGRKLVSIPGAPPNLKYKITGCRFADRCPYVTPECRQAEPEMVENDGRGCRCILPEARLKEMKSFGET